MMKIVHEGRGGYIEIDGHRYVIEHVERGVFAIHFPSGNRASSQAHRAVLEALCRAEPEKWRIEGRRSHR